MQRLMVLGLATFAVAGVALVAFVTPKSVHALSTMSAIERSVYLTGRHTSDLVSYYCGGKPLSATVDRDVAEQLRAQGVSECTVDGVTRIVPGV